MAFLGIFSAGVAHAQDVGSSFSSDREAVLPEVTVEATGSSPGALPPTYTGGQVATGGRVGLLGNKDFMETPLNAISYTEKFIQDKQAQDIQSVIAATDPTVFTPGSTGMLTENYKLRGFNVSTNDVALGGLYGMAPLLSSRAGNRRAHRSAQGAVRPAQRHAARRFRRGQHQHRSQARAG
jgi:iron complex outermembrane receptor protein